MPNKKAGVWYFYGKKLTGAAPGSDQINIIIDSDNVVWIDRNWPTELSIGIPLQELEELITVYKEAFKERYGRRSI